ncbi:MAG: CAP domain-containing protein [Nitrosopumilaceae archaeon]
MKFCPKCGSFVNKNKCPNCGYNSKPFVNFKKITISLGIGIFIIIIVFFIIHNTAQPITQQPIIPNNQNLNHGLVINSTSQSLPSHDNLIQFALAKINEDRTKKGLNPVLLSNNTAAQIHAEDVLKTGVISHWMTNGEKPYMTYSEAGGLGYVAQNIAVDGGYQYKQECNNVNIICDKIDPIKAIEGDEYDMMFNDSSSNWGHRDNILDRHRTHVSLGIAYDDYAFVVVQNFENNYIDFSNSITEKNGTVHFSGTLKTGAIEQIGIYYDELPNSVIYEQNKHRTSYSLGDQIGVVVKPPLPNEYYQQPIGYSLIVANQWVNQSGSNNISFNMSPIMNKQGVYTIVVLIDDNGDRFPVTTYSIFKK